MAGDWIKMRIDLQSHPKVVRILSATKADKFRVIGGLHAVWSVFDAHSTDGILSGYTPEAMDHIIGWPGFSDAMMAVNWLGWDGAASLTMPEFDEHNGASAKRRCEDQKRKRNGRKSDKSPQSVRNLSANDADKSPDESGLEKRREEKSKDSTSNDVLVAEEPDDGPGSCPQKVLIAAYHQILPELPPVNEWSVANAKAMRQRWRSNPDRSSVDWWKGFFEYVKASDFLTGRKTSFQASLGWIVKAENFAKILNGQYENRI